MHTRSCCAWCINSVHSAAANQLLHADARYTIGIGPLSGSPYTFDGMYYAEVMGGMSIQGHNNVSG
jgi:hypothetical protein